MKDRPNNVSIYDRHVAEYVNRFMDLGLYKETFTPLLNLLPHSAKILELGCGPGNVVKYLHSQSSDLKITGIDLSAEMIEEARRQNPDADFHVMDVAEINTLPAKFDAVLATFCLPYISYDAAEELIGDSSELLGAGGLFYLSCMEGPASRSGFEKTSFTGDDEMYINYYQREQLENWIANSSLKLIHFETKDYEETDGSTTIDLFFTARRI